MSEVIQPAAGQTVITTDHDHRHHGGHHDDHFRETRLDADYRSLVAAAERNATAAQVASCRTDSLVQGGFGGVSGEICESTKDITSAVGTVGTAGALAACETNKAIADVKFIGMETAKDNLIAMNVGFAAGQNGVNTGFAAQSVLATTIGNAQNVLSNAIGNAASVQATNYFNQATVQVERVRAELEAKTAAGFSAATLLATQLDAQARREAAKCCCDGEKLAMDNFAKLSALVTADGNTTRALINTNTIEALRAQLVATQRLIPPTIAVGA